MRLAVYTVCALVAVAWTLQVGKDVPWDALHYHLYAGFSAVNDRLTTDFFIAGPQTYLNPYAHLPLYLMVHAGWSSLTVGVALACLHSVILWMTYELAHAVSRRPDGSAPAVVTLTAVALAAMNPVLLQELGSTFTDITTGALALAGYALLAQAFTTPGRFRVALGGALLGAASALKLSNAFLAMLPAVVLVLGCGSTLRERVRALLSFGFGACIAMLLVAGPWAWQLAQAFGNPFFPMLDDAFHPSQAVAQAVPGSAVAAAPSSLVDALLRLFNGMRDPRFLPSSLAEALSRPFDMLKARRLIHTEPMAADGRYAVLVLLLPLWALATWHWRRHAAAAAAGTAPTRRAQACLAGAWLVAWAVWLGISGNSRYFVPMGCVAAVLLAVGLHRLLGAYPRALAYALVVVVGGQGLLLWHAVDGRWNPQPWSGPWIQPSVPQRLQHEPYLYLPMDSQSQSFLLPWLAPGSSFLGLNAGLTPDGRNGARARALIEANAGRLRMLKLVEAIEADGRPIVPSVAVFDHSLRSFGLRVDTGDCDFITYQGSPSVIQRAGPKSGPRDVVRLYTCRVVIDAQPAEREVDPERKRRADIVLDRLEQACPELFRPRAGSLRSGALWRRNYGDVVTWVNDDGLVRFTDLMRGGGDITFLGRQEDWLDAPPKLTCGRKAGLAHVEIEKR